MKMCESVHEDEIICHEGQKMVYLSTHLYDEENDFTLQCQPVAARVIRVASRKGRTSMFDNVIATFFVAFETIHSCIFASHSHSALNPLSVIEVTLACSL